MDQNSNRRNSARGCSSFRKLQSVIARVGRLVEMLRLRATELNFRLMPCAILLKTQRFIARNRALPPSQADAARIFPRATPPLNFFNDKLMRKLNPANYTRSQLHRIPSLGSWVRDAPHQRVRSIFLCAVARHGRSGVTLPLDRHPPRSAPAGSSSCWSGTSSPRARAAAPRY